MVIPGNDRYGDMGARQRVCDASDSKAASSTDSSVNVIPGQITAHHRGLLNVSVRVRIGKRTDLRVRWPLHSDMTPELVPGLSVKAVISVEAVILNPDISDWGSDGGIGGSDELSWSKRCKTHVSFR